MAINKKESKKVTPKKLTKAEIKARKKELQKATLTVNSFYTGGRK